MRKIFIMVCLTVLAGPSLAQADDFGARFDDQRPDALADIDAPPQGIYSLEDILNIEPAAGGDQNGIGNNGAEAGSRINTEYLGGGRVRVRDQFRLRRSRGSLSQ